MKYVLSIMVLAAALFVNACGGSGTTTTEVTSGGTSTVGAAGGTTGGAAAGTTNEYFPTQAGTMHAYRVTASSSNQSQLSAAASNYTETITSSALSGNNLEVKSSLTFSSSALIRTLTTNYVWKNQALYVSSTRESSPVNVNSTNTTTYTPEMLVLPSSFTPGTHQTSSAVSSRNTVSNSLPTSITSVQEPIGTDLTVNALETVSVPAGTFQAVKITMITTSGTGTLASQSTSTLWFAKGVGLVKIATATRGGSGNAASTGSTTGELTSYTVPGTTVSGTTGGTTSNPTGTGSNSSSSYAIESGDGSLTYSSPVRIAVDSYGNNAVDVTTVYFLLSDMSLQTSVAGNGGTNGTVFMLPNVSQAARERGSNTFAFTKAYAQNHANWTFSFRHTGYRAGSNSLEPVAWRFKAMNNTLPYYCDLTAPSYGKTYSLCSELGISFDSATGKLVFSSTVLENGLNLSETMTVTGTVSFPPF